MKQAFQHIFERASQYRFTLVFALSGLVVVGLGAFILADLRRAQREIRAMHNNSVAGLDLIAELQYQTQEARRSMIYALTTPDANRQVEHADASRAADAQVANRLAQHRLSAQSPAEIKSITAFERGWTSYLAIRDEMMASILEGSAREALARDQREGMPAFDLVRDDLQTIERVFKERAGQQVHQVDALFTRTIVKLGIVLVVTLLFAGFAGTTVQNGRMLRAVQSSEARLREVIGSINEGMFVIRADGRVELWNEAAERALCVPRNQILDCPLFEVFPRWRDTAMAGAMDAALQRSQPAVLSDLPLHPTELDRVFELRVFPFEQGATVFFEDVTERKRVEAKLKESEHRLRSILESEPECVKLVAADGILLDMNPAGLRMVEADRSEQVMGSSVFGVLAPPYHALFRELHEAVFRGESRIAEFEIIGLKGTRRWLETHACPLRDANGKIFAQLAVSRDITGRKKAEAELEAAHQRLIVTSRQAGMAEVATGVLHNVGNVLNSVNVSTTLVAEQVKKSKVANLAKAVELMNEHLADLGGFLTNDPRGKQLPGYLTQLASHFAAEQTTLLNEIEQLRKNIEHIKDIVAMQQSYAKISGVSETLKISDLIEDALRMNAAALARHEVEVVREFADIPLVTIDKHKVLQVLVNLIRNAKYACDDSGRPDKRMTVRVANGEGRLRIAVIDNGVGIPAENLIRIFNHGFTTRKEGHGFGLHSGALAAKEMGGALHVHSNGSGRGATFTLDLPVNLAKAII